MSETGEQRPKFGFLRNVRNAVGRVMAITEGPTRVIFGISEKAMEKSLEGLRSPPVAGAVDVVPADRVVGEAEPMIQTLEEDRGKLAGDEYKNAVRRANNPQEIAAPVASEMRSLAKLREHVDQIGAKIEKDASGVIQTATNLTGLDILEREIQTSHTEDFQRITDQYQAQVASVVRAAISGHIENTIRDARQRGYPYPPTGLPSSSDIASTAIRFSEEVWKLMEELGETASAQSREEAQQDPQPAESVGTDNQATDKPTAEDRKATQKESDGGKKGSKPEKKLGKLIDGLPIDTEKRRKVRIEIEHILDQYLAALRPNTAQALLNATSIALLVEQRIEEARTSVVNAPAVMETGSKVRDLLGCLHKMQEADPEIRKKIADPALQRVSELLKELSPGNEDHQADGASNSATEIILTLNELQSLLREYAGESLSDERAKAILESVESIANTRLGEGETQLPVIADTPAAVEEPVAAPAAETVVSENELLGYELVKTENRELPLAGDRWQEECTTPSGDTVEWGVHHSDEGIRLWVYDPDRQSEAQGGLLQVEQEKKFIHGKFVATGEIINTEGKHTVHIKLFQITTKSLQNFLRAGKGGDQTSATPLSVPSGYSYQRTIEEEQERALDALRTGLDALEKHNQTGSHPVGGNMNQRLDAAMITPTGSVHQSKIKKSGEPRTNPETEVRPPQILLGERPSNLEPLDPQVIIKNIEGRGRGDSDGFSQHSGFNIRVASTQEKDKVYIQLYTSDQRIEGLIADFSAEPFVKEIRVESAEIDYVLWGEAVLYHESDGTPKVVYAFEVCKKREQTQPSSAIAPSILPDETPPPEMTGQPVVEFEEEHQKVALARWIQARVREWGSGFKQSTHDHATDLGDWARKALSQLDRRGDGISQAQIEQATASLLSTDMSEYSEGTLFNNRRDGLRSLERPENHEYFITVGVTNDDSKQEIPVETGTISVKTLYPGDQLVISFIDHSGHYFHPPALVATTEVSSGIRMGSVQVSREYGIRYTSRLTRTDETNPKYPINTYQCNVEVCSAIDLGGLTCSDSVKEVLKTEGFLLSDIPQTPYLQFLKVLDMHDVRRGDWSFGKFCALRDQACALLGITPVSVDLIGTHLNPGWLDEVERLYKERKTAEVVDMIAMVYDPNDTVKALEILKKYEYSYFDISYLLHHSDKRKAKAAVDTLLEMNKYDILHDFVNPANQKVYPSRSAREYAEEKLKLFHDLEEHT